MVMKCKNHACQIDNMSHHHLEMKNKRCTHLVTKDRWHYHLKINKWHTDPVTKDKRQSHVNEYVAHMHGKKRIKGTIA